MEVAIPGSNNGGSPFQREVREWQRIDPNTGALLTGRLEADRWINGSLNSYGKVVDSQNVSQPNGTQHSQRKQLEVIQARTSSGSMQVIRAHTVQTTSSRRTATSSSSASSSNSSSPLMTSITGGYIGSNSHPQRFHANLSLTNEPADSGSNNGPTTDEDHLTSNFHLNHHPKQQQPKPLQQQQHHLFSTAPSLKLSNLMKSTTSVTNGTCGSQNKAASLHKSNNTSPASHRPQRHQQFSTSSSRQQLPKSDTAAAAILQHTSSSSSMSSTSTTTTAMNHNRKSTATSNGTGSIRFDNSRYDLPTTDAYVGGGSSSGGKIIDICSRDIDDVGADDDTEDRVNSSASRRRQETTWHSTLQRGRSVSTDDLTSNGNAVRHPDGGGGIDYDDGDDDEPAEWRRVSKIRRSFQFPSTTAAELSSPVSRPRPTDLPERSVNVSKIRAELENGRRLSTAMRNNHVDLVALDSILNAGSASGSGTASPLTTKKKTASFLTAESLKEIRGKLKKLSDESLYKDDFVTKKDDDRGPIHEVVPLSPEAEFQYTPLSNGSVHTTNSLESRTVKSKDTSSAEWHLRRKSYGFEKMSPPDDKSMFRFENSTDSGLGRSSDLGNWSPTTDSAARATVITFGEQAKIANSESKARPMVHRRLRNRTQPQSEAESAEMKRHSIAVDESQYVRENLRKTSAVHLNGFYSKDTSPQNSGFSDDNSRRQKRVEFCKTEVHFAAESGRVNIVETDGKPPPSNNFRRRRRSSSSSSLTSSSCSSISSLESGKTGLPVIHFGDERKSILDVDDELADDKSPMSNVTVSIPINLERNFDSESRDGDDHQDEISIRGILKNKPVKPKPYHLGENIESADALWGVQLKPVGPRSFSAERDQTEEDFKETTVSSKSVAERVRIVEERKEGAGYSTKINLSLSNSPYEWTDTEVPQSNIMNIELHSPLATTIKKPESIRMQPPVAKPRTINTIKQSTVHKQQVAQQKSVNSVVPLTAAEASEHLKIVKEARGARKLREHELSYFGVKVSSADTTDARSAIETSKPRLTTNPKRSLPSRKLSSKDDERSSNKWSLPSDKPDLLRHSPILVEPQVITKTAIVAPSIGTQRHRSKSPADSSDDQTDGIYENISKPTGSYCRQTDLKRDEMILSEMTRTADQTLKAVSDEAAQKDLRRRSVSRRSSKPLETIDEKFTKPISKTATRSKTSAHRIVRECSTRPSSASSGESLPSTPTRQRSRSRETAEYVNVKPKSTSRLIKHRSSSRESQRSATSSTEDIAHKVEVIRKPKRSSTKDEPHLVRHHSSQQQRSLRSSTESNDRRKVTPRSSTRDRVENRDPPQSRSHRQAKSDVEPKRSSHTSTVDSKSSTTATRSRPENEKSSKSTTERVTRSKAHSSHSTSEHHHKPHRSTGSKSATMSSSGNNSDILIHSKNANRTAATHSSSSSSKTTDKRSAKDRK